ncbi:unnamed protein product (mitochondrion) [Plasmodiophora brassicae]|uniref:Uncharacterized protein n=1 Tax=Plasmodiophora brassicae TaxID=37360 RepID=A0A3P3YP69_PLABS|nr:unnamed protein product [Plasmodiophora brassicae]
MTRPSAPATLPPWRSSSMLYDGDVSGIPPPYGYDSDEDDDDDDDEEPYPARRPARRSSAKRNQYRRRKSKPKRSNDPMYGEDDDDDQTRRPFRASVSPPLRHANSSTPSNKTSMLPTAPSALATVRDGADPDDDDDDDEDDDEEEEEDDDDDDSSSASCSGEDAEPPRSRVGPRRHARRPY